MMMNKFSAGAVFPKIELPTLNASLVEIAKPQGSADWRLVVIYRGKHCPLCTRYLNELETLQTEFKNIGVDVIAVSADSKEQLQQHMEKLHVSFPIAYGLNFEQMKSLGLYVSSPRSEQETDHLFAEPGLFVVNEQGQVQVVDISNAPFARPDLKTLLAGIEFIRNPANNYPIRGTYEK
ncbi:AhpC/TSA family protein [Vibrio ponticus]|uniref:AhpC/TSA family protein n=1 Tax=Vibrio ponticus TaxID=265668 RepID=A0A3N3E665_9VIBR|nr:peroxiredoxin-like family protein [Vibrio ponticus]ROV62223.1 AhpC/TSA family protein [Vibrio ponticus]